MNDTEEYFIKSMKEQAERQATLDSPTSNKNKTVVKSRKGIIKLTKRHNKKMYKALIEDYYNEHLTLLKEKANEDRVHPGE